MAMLPGRCRMMCQSKKLVAHALPVTAPMPHEPVCKLSGSPHLEEHAWARPKQGVPHGVGYADRRPAGLQPAT